jgi:hypothetical protein
MKVNYQERIGEHPDFANMQNYEKIYPFWGKPTLSFPKKSVLEWFFRTYRCSNIRIMLKK